MATATPRQNLAAERQEQGFPPKINDAGTLAKVAVLVVTTNKAKAA